MKGCGTKPIHDSSPRCWEDETDCVVEAAKLHPLYCHFVKDLIWSEIDDYSHFAGARDIVYPAILKTAHKRQRLLSHEPSELVA